MEQFRKLAPWKQEVYREMHTAANRQEQMKKTMERRHAKMTPEELEAELELENAMSILLDIGVPFTSDGEPLGIG